MPHIYRSSAFDLRRQAGFTFKPKSMAICSATCFLFAIVMLAALFLAS